MCSPKLLGKQSGKELQESKWLWQGGKKGNGDKMCKLILLGYIIGWKAKS